MKALEHELIHSQNPQVTLETALNSIFPQATDESNIIRTKRILGETAKTLSDEQISYIVTEFQFLINSWLDEFEKEIFSGSTLRHVLNEK